MIGLRLVSAGKPLLLGPRIGRGGEGEIYALADGSGRAVKLYIQPDAAREAKVCAMIASRAVAACPDVAFPQEIVRHADGRFAGFIMAQVTDHQPIHELIGASSRRRFFPRANWQFLARVALNLARVMTSVHAAGIVVGDINSAGILVSHSGTVKLIDADSFQISGHRCRVGMPEYTPAELQGVDLGGIDRTTNHDAFGLAVMVFQILMLGRHPFAGVARGRPIALHQAIRDGRFAFTQFADVGIKPPPNSLTLGDLPRAIRHLFERAFLASDNPRPSATEWVSVLSDLEASLIACPVRADHVMAPISIRCPWCRIEQATGRATFAPQKAATVPATDPLSERLRADLTKMLRRGKRQAGEGIEPPWYERRPETSDANAGRAGVSNSVGQNVDIAELIDRQRDAMLGVERALARWRTQIGVWDVIRLSHEVAYIVTKLERFESRRTFLLSVGAAQSVDEHVHRILAGQLLTGIRVPGVGNALVGKLARYGIINAADLRRDRLVAITGLGEKRIVALLFWREALAVAAEKRIKRSAGRLEAMRGDAAVRLDHQRAIFERSIRSGLADLGNAVDLVHKRASRTDAELAAALRARDQATSDIALLGGTFAALRPTAGAPNKITPQAVPKKRKTGKSAGKAKANKACPSCGATMVKRWGGLATGKSSHYGCSAYPRCNGVRAIPPKGGRP